MKRLFYLLAISIIFILSLKINAQEFSIRVGMGYGNYLMDDMKALQKSIHRDFFYTGVKNIKIVSEFPGYLNFHFDFAGQIAPDIRLGVSFAHYSTGGRVNYEDYSGRIDFDQLLTGNSMGGFVEVKTFNNRYLSGYLGFKLSVLSTKLYMKAYTRIYQQEDNQAENFISISACLEPYLNLEFPLLQGFSSIINIGYSVDTSGNFELEDNSDAYLTLYGTKVKSNWSGLRIKFAIDYSF